MINKVLKLTILFATLCLSSCVVQPLNQQTADTGEGVDFEPALTSQVAGYSFIRAVGDVQAGEQLFNLICTDCHSYVDVNDIPSLSFEVDSAAKKAPNLNQMGGEQKGDELTEAYLSATITYGKGENVNAHSMPAWGNILTQAEIDNLVAFIRKVKTIQRSQKLP